jgi:hypothetical protein
MSINDSNRGNNAMFFYVMGDDIAHRIQSATGKMGNNFPDIHEKFPEWLLKKAAVVFREGEHQRTFRA